MGRLQVMKTFVTVHEWESRWLTRMLRVSQAGKGYTADFHRTRAGALCWLCLFSFGAQYSLRQAPTRSCAPGGNSDTLPHLSRGSLAM